MTLNYAPDVRNGMVTPAPFDDLTPQEWHRAASGDTGVSYNLPGRLYVVQCEWCPEAFAANTKRDAMAMFRQHEAPMLTDGAAR